MDAGGKRAEPVGAGSGGSALTALFAGFLAILFILLRMYGCAISDWEVQHELRHAVECITEDVAYAQEVWLDDDGTKLCLRTFSCDASETVGVVYFWKKGGSSRLMKDGQPMTGESCLGRVEILEFRTVPQGEQQIWLRIRARNMVTRHEYLLETVVQIYDGKIRERFY